MDMTNKMKLKIAIFASYPIMSKIVILQFLPKLIISCDSISNEVIAVNKDEAYKIRKVLAYR